MVECPLIPNCNIYSQLNNSRMKSVWVLAYCRGNHHKCKPKELLLSGKTVPADMLPNGKTGNTRQPTRRSY